MVGKRINIKFLCFLMILLISGLAFGAYTVQIDGGDYDFTYRRTVTIQSGQVQGGPHGDFPMLFDSKTDAGLQADLASAAGKVESPDGYDIVFATTEGVEIFSHEIEKYEGSTGEYIAWIKIPASSPLSNSTQFYMYYGSTDITDENPDKDSQHVTDVWSNGYRGVWHLSEEPTVDSYAYDSTTYSNDGTMVNGDLNDQDPGQINGCLDFNGFNEYINANDSPSLRIPGSFTVSAWINTDDLPSYGDIRPILAKGADSDNPGENHNYSLALENGLLTGGNAVDVIYEPWQGAGSMVGAMWSTSLDTGNRWYYIVGVHDASANTLTLYVDGVQRAQNTSAFSTPDTGPTPFRIGHINVSGYSLFNGHIDEVRVITGPRSLDWIVTCHNNQDSPGTFYSIAAEQTLVELCYFRANPLNGAVFLEWATETELENEGFNLWKSGEENGEYGRINPYFIPSQGESGLGAEYSFTDYDVTNGVIYYYKLEDIDINGKSSFHGPVSATPNDIILIWPDEWEILPSGGLSLSWASSGNYSFKVEISSSPSFAASKTLAFPEEDWTSGLCLWIRPDQWKIILRKAQESGGQVFWRIRAKSENGRVFYSGSRKFIIEKISLLKNSQTK